MISIKPATEDILPRLLEIEQETFTNPWTYGMFQEEFLRQDSFFTVISENGNPLGFCILRRMTDDEGQLFNIAVAKSARRQGFADTLMKVAIRHAEDNGLKSLYLEVRESNEAAIALYGQHGFKQVGTRKGYYDKPTEDALIMTKDIVPGSGTGCCAGRG